MGRKIVVKPGDTLSAIATASYGDAALAVRLATYNGLRNPDLLCVGETLELPSLKELKVSAPVPSSPPRQTGLAPPTGLDSIIHTFGNIYDYIREDGHLRPEWEQEHFARAPLPFGIPLSWDRTKQATGIYCHRKLGELVSDVFEKIDTHGLRGQIKTFGGCFNYRPKRQSSKLSTHSWGIAIDINPETNRQGTAGDINPDVVAIFKEAGFTWGGDWAGKSKDPMHFQFCRGY